MIIASPAGGLNLSILFALEMFSHFQIRGKIIFYSRETMTLRSLKNKRSVVNATVLSFYTVNLLKNVLAEMLAVNISALKLAKFQRFIA